MRIRCYACREWSNKRLCYRYHMAEKTPWRPPLEIDPRMRQFKCENCGNEIHIVFTDAMLEQELPSGC